MGRVGSICILALLSGMMGLACSVRKIAVNKIGDALAGGGTTFASDDDPELVKAALPFSLKLIESLLAENPRHKGLLLAAASGFTQFGYGFVQQEADELEARDFAAAQEMRLRARRLFLRARDYGMRGLELEHRDFAGALRKDPKAALLQARRQDVPLLYWTASAGAAATSILKDNAELIADLGIVEAMIDRALELQEDYDSGAIHSFLISYEMSRQGVPGDGTVRSRRHFERAMQLGGGQLAGPLVSFAEAVSVQKQDAKEFKSLLEKALAINPDGKPESRLANKIMQRRARWLLGRMDELFITPIP